MKSLFSSKLTVSLLLSSISIIQPFAGVSFAAKEQAPQVSFTIDKVVNENNYKKFSINGSSKYKADVTIQFVDKEETTLMKTINTNDKGEFKLTLNLASLVDGNLKVKVTAVNKKGNNTKSQTITKKIVENVIAPPIKQEPPITVTPAPPVVAPPITQEPPVIVPPIAEPTPNPEPPVIVPPINKSFPKGTGVNVFYDSSKEMHMIKDGGFSIVRADLYWSWIEGKKGVYNFEVNNYDILLDSILSKGMTPYMLLAYGNPIYGEGDAFKTKAGMEAYIRYVDVVTKRYSGKKIIWEIYNEPNGSGNAYHKEYAELVIEAAKTIRKNDPTGHVVAPALAGTSPESFNYLERVFKEGILEYIDAVSVHPYRSWEPESAWYEYDVLRKMIKKYTTKEIRIVNGEWGYSTTQGWWDLYLTDKQQAAYAVRMFLTDRMNDVDISIWYNWKNDSNDKKNSEHNFGLLNANATTKDGYYAMDTFHELTAGYEFKNRLDVKNEDDYLVKLTNKDNKTVYVAWTVGNTHKVKLPLTNVTGQIKDMFGKKQSDYNSTTSTSISLSETPVYIIVE